jgi:RHS repeat-associated protein
VTDTATGAKTSYVYDADGNRIMAKKSDGSAQLWAGDTEFTASGTGVVTFTRSYSAGGEPVAIRHDTKLDIVSADHHGTPVVLVDGATAAATRRHYSPFGEDLDTSAWPADRGFLDKTKDSTGYAHLDARDYDAALGRFISADPLIDFTDPASRNGYAYAANSPLVFSDPSGLCWGPDLICKAASAVVNVISNVISAVVTTVTNVVEAVTKAVSPSGSGNSSPSVTRPSGQSSGNDAARRGIIAAQAKPTRWNGADPPAVVLRRGMRSHAQRLSPARVVGARLDSASWSHVCHFRGSDGSSAWGTVWGFGGGLEESVGFSQSTVYGRSNAEGAAGWSGEASAGLGPLAGSGSVESDDAGNRYFGYGSSIAQSPAELPSILRLFGRIDAGLSFQSKYTNVIGQ